MSVVLAQNELAKERAPAPVSGRFTMWLRPGLAGSLLLHVLLVFLVFRQVGALQIPHDLLSVIPADLVELANETASPPANQRAAVPQQQASLAPRRAPQVARRVPVTPPPTGTAPSKPEPVPETPAPPRDELQAKLERLAKLRQPDASPATLPLSGVSNLTAAGNNARPGQRATYSVKDYVEAQVERRWNLDVSTLEGRNVEVLIHVVMTSDGTIAKAEIVDDGRAKTDAMYHDIALSARNAVLLSSPIALPAGTYDAVMDMTLNLNPKDTLR